MSPKQERKQKPRKGRVAMPPPQEAMRDRRARRPADALRRELEHEVDLIDITLKEVEG